MVKNKSEFDDTKGYNEKEILEKRLAKAKRTVEVLQKQLNVAWKSDSFDLNKIEL